jgi:hypothetical protein
VGPVSWCEANKTFSLLLHYCLGPLSKEKDEKDEEAAARPPQEGCGEEEVT